MAKKRKKGFALKIARLLWLLISLILSIFLKAIKSTYFLVKNLVRGIGKKAKEIRAKKARPKIPASPKKLSVLKSLEGKFSEFEKSLAKSDSTIGIVIGARGSGKTAAALRILENLHPSKKNLYSMGLRESDLPLWIKNVSEISKIKNNSFVLIDEGGILFSSRKSMSSANKILSDLLLIARHKNISVIFISQNSSNLDINILRQADYLILKKSSLLQKEFERKIIRKIYEEISKDFKKFKTKRASYIYSSKFRGFVSFPLSSFWSQKVSKAFR